MLARQLRFAVTGTSSVGKTSLVRELMAEPRFSSVVPLLIPEGARHLLRQLGHSSIDAMSPTERVQFQRSLFYWQKEQESTDSSYLADRSFVDAAAVWRERDARDAPRAMQEELPAECRKLAERYDLLIHLPHGAIPFEADGLRSADGNLHLRIAARIESYLAEWNLPVFTPRSTTLSNRVTEVCDHLAGLGFIPRV